MIRRPPRSTQSRSSAASDVYKRQGEVIEDSKTGFVVEKENPEKLAEAIIRYYKEDKEKEFSQSMKSLKEKYSWQNFVKGMFELIKN